MLNSPDIILLLKVVRNDDQNYYKNDVDLVRILAEPEIEGLEKRANEGTRTPEWWNHNPLP